MGVFFALVPEGKKRFFCKKEPLLKAEVLERPQKILFQISKRPAG
jgi:hypothetical protein